MPDKFKALVVKALVSTLALRTHFVHAVCTIMQNRLLQAGKGFPVLPASSTTVGDPHLGAGGCEGFGPHSGGLMLFIHPSKNVCYQEKHLKQQIPTPLTCFFCSLKLTHPWQERESGTET